MKHLLISVVILLSGCGEGTRFYGYNDTTVTGLIKPQPSPPSNPGPEPKPDEDLPPDPFQPRIPPAQTPDCSSYENEIQILRTRLKKCSSQIECLEEENFYLRSLLGYDPIEH